MVEHISTPVSRPGATQAGGVPEDTFRFRVYSVRQLDQIAPLQRLSRERRLAIRVAATVLPFLVNKYVIDELIDWDNVPDDPMFQMTFPQPGMLPGDQFNTMADLLSSAADEAEVREAARRIRNRLNPHPGGQQDLNVPCVSGQALPGIQHKYPETVLFFPSQGQTCHSYCTFCFRWPQFIGKKELRFAAADASGLWRYLRAHREVSDLLVTGGDPLVMKTRALAACLEPLLKRDFEHIQNIRIGTKALIYWPYRVISDEDAADLLRLFEKLVRAGKHLALMLHVDHWRELEPPLVREAIRRVRDTGAVIRTQAPLLAHINDDAEVWVRLWRDQVRLGMVPYYMFVERHTGPAAYFEVPLARGWEIYRTAVKRLSGLGRTARGPSMSAGPGKVEIQGVAEINGEKVFALRFIQGRNPDWVQRPFFARFDPQATWFSQLEPAFGEKEFFFEPEYRQMRS